MKPLPLLLTLFGLAFVGAIALVQLKSFRERSKESELTAPLLPPAPLPVDFEEPPPPLPIPPLLEEELIPDRQLISFVENYLGLSFSEPPVFTPVPAEVVITTIEDGIHETFSPEKLEALNLVCQRLGVFPEFQQLDQNIVTILAGEVRGLITPTRNLVLNDFVTSSPPEQAALVNLLAQRLLSEKLPFPKNEATVDEILARHFTTQNLALAAEKEFRKTLPNYPPSLNENIRESILLGLPAFFHELSTFAEFHLLEKLATSTPKDALTSLSKESSSPSRQLLAFPFKLAPSEQSTQLGAIPLYLFLLESTDPTTARTLATGLTGDRIEFEENILTWTLTFASEKSPPRAAEFFRSYFSLRDPERKVKILVSDQELVITSR